MAVHLPGRFEGAFGGEGAAGGRSGCGVRRSRVRSSLRRVPARSEPLPSHARVGLAVESADEELGRRDKELVDGDFETSRQAVERLGVRPCGSVTNALHGPAIESRRGDDVGDSPVSLCHETPEIFAEGILGHRFFASTDTPFAKQSVLMYTYPWTAVKGDRSVERQTRCV